MVFENYDIIYFLLSKGDVAVGCSSGVNKLDILIM